jgi:hypothetical protein
VVSRERSKVQLVPFATELPHVLFTIDPPELDAILAIPNVYSEFEFVRVKSHANRLQVLQVQEDLPTETT